MPIAAGRDIRGIYLVVPIRTPIVGGPAKVTKAAANPSVDGLYLMDTWAAVEPSSGQFDWSYLDRQIAEARKLGKKVSIGIWAGSASPQWIYENGAERFSTVVAIPRRREFCEPISLPIPWDPIFLAEQEKLIREMGTHFRDAPDVVMIKVTSISYRTDELLLPRERGREVRGEAIADYRVCRYPDDISNWKRIGYTSGKVSDAFRHLMEQYNAAFPDKMLALMLGRDGFPSIGRVGESDPAAANLPVSTLLPIATGMLGDRFVMQVNNLRADQVEPAILGASRGGTKIGFQAAWPVTGDPHCRMTGGRSPCDQVAVFDQTIRNVIEARAAYVELFKEDIVNSKFAAILAQAAEWFRQ
ncbi:MAG: beta-galactosidase [Candidatus Binatia bacterium]